MMKNIKYRSVYLVIAVVFVLLFAACSSEMQAASQEVQVSVPTVIVQQYVTQVVATAVPSEPTKVPVQPTAQAVAASSGWDPFSAPVYYPLQGCVASRLHVGDRAYVAYGSESNNIHYSEEIGYAPVFRGLYPGEIMEIIGGPYCERGAVVWQVFALADEQVGFVGEGNGDVYWLLPLPADGESQYKKYEQQEALSRVFGGNLPALRPAPGTCKDRAK